MKKALATILLATTLWCAPAQAQLAVADFTSYYNQAQSLFQDLKGYATQLQQLQQAVSTVQHLGFMAENFIHDPSIGTAMALANMLGLDLELPINPYAAQRLVSGFGGRGAFSFASGIGSLGSLVNTHWGANNVYECKTNSYACQQMQARAASTAGMQGVVGQVYQSLNRRLPILASLRTQLETTSDPKTVMDIQAQIAIEQAWVQNAQGQLTAAVAMGEAAKQVSENQEREAFSASLQAVIASAPQ